MSGTLFSKRRTGLAIACMLGSSFVVALMGVSVKFGSFADLTTASMVFWRNLLSLGFVCIWMLGTKHPAHPVFHRLKTKQWHLHLVRGVSSFSAAFLYFWSINFIDLASATALFNTLPIFVPIVAWCWKGISFVHRLWWGIGISFLGILCVLQPGTGIFHWGSCIALLSGIAGAVSVVALRFSHSSEHPGTMLFYLFAICTVAAGVFSLFSFHQSWGHFLWSDAVIFLAIGVFGFMNQLLLTAATKFGPIRLLSPFSYAAVIFAMIFAWVIWGTVITLFQFLGFLLIVIGAILMVFLYPKEKAN